MSPVEFRAPWARRLRLTTTVSIVTLLAISIAGWFSIHRFGVAWGSVMIGLPLAILLVAVITWVRGYTLTENEIRIKRLGWLTKLSLAGLLSVEGKADAMQGSLRIFGNGGVFSYTGLFWNRQLKLHRIYATDPERAVILRYANRVIVISPHDPQHFIVRVRTLLKTAEFRI